MCVCLLGPAIGGYFVYPAKQLPWLFGHNQFLIEYPFFLPCFISSLLSFTGFLLGYFLLEETNKSIAKNQLNERTPLLTRPQSQSMREQLENKFPKDSIYPIIGQWYGGIHTQIKIIFCFNVHYSSFQFTFFLN
jgi:hypothetical protein